MKKTFVLGCHTHPFAGIACILAVLVLFSSCKNQKSTDDSESTDAIETEISTMASAPSVGATETTLFFDPTPYVIKTDAPAVILAAEYEKQAVDVLNGGSFNFVHQISIPALDSDKPGAKALNAKIFEQHSTHIEELKTDAEDNRLYHIFYSSSKLGSMVFINVQTTVGWQYSEMGFANYYYYYDAAADREVSAEEYLAYFGLEADTLAKEAALSDAYLRAVDTQHFYYGQIEDEELRGLMSAASAVPEAYEVTAEVIHVWMRTVEDYIDCSFICDIDTENGMPCNPSYAFKAKEFIPDADSNGIVFDFSDRTLRGVKAAPEVCSVIQSAYVTSAYVALVCTAALPDPYGYGVEVQVNGNPVGAGSAQYGQNFHVYAYMIKEYTPLKDLKTIEMVISTE
ncbi:MAG: hypothetical protein HFE77_06240 [Clostridiales bacterium]|nr:hypothetical protein [Clostridiales bacterium]